MTTITLSETNRVTLPVRMRRKLGWEPGTRLHILIRDGEIAIRRDLRSEDLGGIMRGYAIPGTTHEQEREAMHQAIAQHYAEVAAQTEE